MRICEYRFNQPDPQNPNYSMLEIDYYSWIPPGKFSEVRNHRLTLRKNLETDAYEIFRKYYETSIETVIAMRWSLERILEIGDNEWNRFHSDWSESKHKDITCDHAESREFCGKDEP